MGYGKFGNRCGRSVNCGSREKEKVMDAEYRKWFYLYLGIYQAIRDKRRIF
jgi:hypothetical protein